MRSRLERQLGFRRGPERRAFKPLRLLIACAWVFSGWPYGPTLGAQEAAPVLEEEVPAPDFSRDGLGSVKGAADGGVVVRIEKDGSDELWRYDVPLRSWERLEDGAVSDGSPFGLKSGSVFWLSEDGATAFAYDPATHARLEQPVPPFDRARGERARMRFPGIPWDVLTDGERFYFYSARTGEVFSDERSDVAETFRRALDLDAVLPAEAMSDAGFSVETHE